MKVRLLQIDRQSDAEVRLAEGLLTRRPGDTACTSRSDRSPRSPRRSPGCLLAAPHPDSGEVQGTLGRPGRYAGEFHWVHDLAIDSGGNLYAGEVDTGKRAQKFARVP